MSTHVLLNGVQSSGSHVARPIYSDELAFHTRFRIHLPRPLF